jgi:hypothetical protein
MGLASWAYRLQKELRPVGKALRDTRSAACALRRRVVVRRIVVEQDLVVGIHNGGAESDRAAVGDPSRLVLAIPVDALGRPVRQGQLDVDRKL